MKINEKILSIPPHISTTWGNISSIKMKASQLSITLNDGDSIHIPGLSEETIDLVFKMHAEDIEKRHLLEPIDKKPLFGLSQALFGDQHKMVESPLKFAFSTLDGLNTIAEHNPQEKNAPDLPDAILEKIGSIAKMVVPNDLTLLPKDVEDCNCFHCQVTRVIHKNAAGNDFEIEVEIHELEQESVSDSELQFNQWNVSAAEENVFTVTNKLDASEQYSVFLGTPVGCNCGEPNCEHIIAVLKT